MNEAEWLEVRRTLLSAFPDLLTKLSFLGGQEQVTATTRMWRETLKGFTSKECLKVIGQWVRGERDPFRPNEWDRVALIIRSRIQFDRSEASRQNSPAKETGKRLRDDRGLGDMEPLYRAMAAKMAGEIDDEQMAELTRKAIEQIPTTDVMREPRYDCHLCCDRGTVRVYNERSVHELKRDPNYDGVIGDCDMAMCFCSVGNQFNNEQRPFAKFSRSRFCQVRAVERSDQVEEIREWITSQRKAEWVA